MDHLDGNQIKQQVMLTREQEKQTVEELTMKPKEEIEWILKAQRKHPNELNIIKVKNIE